MAKNDLEFIVPQLQKVNILNDIMNMCLLTTNYLKVSMPARAIANQKIVWHT